MIEAIHGRHGVDFNRTEKGVSTVGRVVDEATLNELLEWARTHGEDER